MFETAVYFIYNQGMKKILSITLLLFFLCAAETYPNPFKEGNRLYMQGKYEEALQRYGEFIQKNPDRFEGFFNAGNALFRAERYEEAVGSYEKALEIKPKDEDAAHNLGVARERVKQQEKQGKNQNNKKNENQQQQSDAGKGQNQQNKANEGQKGQDDRGVTEEEKQAAEQAAAEKRKEAAKEALGITDDEIQALLNRMQKQEEQTRAQMKQQEKMRNTDDIFSMDPWERMEYMRRMMEDPFGQHRQRKGDDREKDW